MSSLSLDMYRLHRSSTNNGVPCVCIDPSSFSGFSVWFFSVSEAASDRLPEVRSPDLHTISQLPNPASRQPRDITATKQTLVGIVGTSQDPPDVAEFLHESRIRDKMVRAAEF